MEKKSKRKGSFVTEDETREILNRLSDEEMRCFFEAFKEFDYNNDGHINTKELSNVMRSLGQNPTESELIDLINEVDVDGNGFVEWEEFCVLMYRKVQETDQESEVSQLFRVFDIEGTGLIDTEEFGKVLMKLPVVIRNEELKELLEEVDPRSEGRIDRGTFRRMYGSSGASMPHSQFS